MDKYRIVNKINCFNDFKEDNKLIANYAKARLGKKLKLQDYEDYSEKLIEITENKRFNKFANTLGNIAYEILDGIVSKSFCNDKGSNIFIGVKVNININEISISKIVDVVIVGKEKIEVIKISSFDYDRLSPKEDMELRLMAFGAAKIFSKITKANIISLICIQSNLRESTVYDMRVDELIRECEEAFM